MNIGEAASTSGVSAKMIRYYESLGVLPQARRTAAGYRRYEEKDIHALRFIRSARDLGFTVDDIGSLLALWQDRGRHSADVKKIASDHIGKLNQKIADLQGMANALEKLTRCCSGDDRPDCPILADLEKGAIPAALPNGRRFGLPGQG